MKLLERGLLLVLASLYVSSQEVNYVKPDGLAKCTEGQNCLTLEEYAQQARDYFTAGSVFIFLVGNHSLQTTVNITDVSNISLRAERDDLSSSILCKGIVTILCENATNLTFKGLLFRLELNKKQRMESSALQFFNCRGVVLLEVKFQGSGNISNGYVRGVYSLFSSLTILSCRFEGNTGYHGGAIYASTGSNITLAGNHFTGNRAEDSGGVLYATVQSRVILKGPRGNTFSNNHGGGFGGVIRCKDSNCDVIESASILNETDHTVNFTKTTPSSENMHVFSNNNAGYGGALALYDSVSIFTGADVIVIFENNTAREGGALHLYSTGLLLTRRATLSTDIKSLEFSENTANDNGGALCSLRGHVYLRNESGGSFNFSKNSAREGGAVYSNEANFEMAGRSSFEGNCFYNWRCHTCTFGPFHYHRIIKICE